MRIFISGPYFSNHKHIIERNVRKAEQIGLVLVEKGHVPYIPHKHYFGWEEKLDYEKLAELDHSWLILCDAVYFFGSSKGVKKEKKIAKKLGIKIIKKLNNL